MQKHKQLVKMCVYNSKQQNSIFYDSAELVIHCMVLEVWLLTDMGVCVHAFLLTFSHK